MVFKKHYNFKNKQFNLRLNKIQILFLISIKTADSWPRL